MRETLRIGIVDTIKNKIASALVVRLNPRVTSRIRKLEAEVMRLTTDNARLQQETRMLSELLRRKA